MFNQATPLRGVQPGPAKVVMTNGYRFNATIIQNDVDRFILSMEVGDNHAECGYEKIARVIPQH